jgi:hypothetical protein
MEHERPHCRVGAGTRAEDTLGTSIPPMIRPGEYETGGTTDVFLVLRVMLGISLTASEG